VPVHVGDEGDAVAVHDVAFTADQYKVTDPPDVTVLGFASKLTAGAVATVTNE